MLNDLASPYLLKAFRYCAINGLASRVTRKSFSLAFNVCVQQWCIKRAKMKTADDYMLPLMHQFISLSLRVMDFSTTKEKIKQLRHLWPSSRRRASFIGFDMDIMRPSKHFDNLHMGCDVKRYQLNWVIKQSPFSVQNGFGKSVFKLIVPLRKSIWPREGLQACPLSFSLSLSIKLHHNLHVGFHWIVARFILFAIDKRVEFCSFYEFLHRVVNSFISFFWKSNSQESWNRSRRSKLKCEICFEK